MRSEGKNISWEQSYVVQDKTFCIYHADGSELIDEHAERSGFPYLDRHRGQSPY